MQGASSLDAAIQLAEWYNAMFSKQQSNPDSTNAGQAKGCNPGPNGQNKSAKVENRAREVQVMILLVQTTSRSPNFL